MDKFTKQLLGTKTQQDVTPNGFNQPRSRFYNSTIRNYWEQGGALAPIIPHPYKSKGTPIYRDTTDSNLFNDGGKVDKSKYYTYKDHRDQYMKKGNQWYISNEFTDFNFQPIKDPKGTRAKELNKNAKEFPIDEGKTFEAKVNKALGNPMDQAYRAAEYFAPPGEDPIDNFRHPIAGRYTTEAISNYVNSGYPIIDKTVGFIGANAMGVGHELNTLLKDKRPWSTKLPEAGEDIYNNFIGTTVGVSSMTPRQKTNYLLNLSNNNQLPDGYGPRDDKKNMYWKDQQGRGSYNSKFENGGELLAQPYPNSFFASDLKSYYADGGPLHDRDNETGKLLNSTYASALGSMFRDGGYFDHGYSLPEDSFRQGGRGLKDSIYASTSGQYPANYKQGGNINVVAGGEKHRVYIKESPTGVGEGIQGHVIVNHPTMDKGQWDTIDLTEKSGAKTVAQGIAATKKWHRENPNVYKQGGSILSMSNTPQLEGEGKDLTYPDGAYVYANGGMLKRADGSYSQRGLWDNIRANKGSGKEPTKEMLRQERKIRNKKAFGGVITTSQLPQANYFDNGGKPKNPKLITYKTDSKLIDGTAAFDLVSKVPISDDYNQQIKERLYTGKWGFDPESGALVKLNKSQQTTIPQNITNIRKEEKEDQEYRAAIQRGEIKPRIDTPIQQPANQQMTKQEVKDFVRQGYNAAILNPAFQTAAYFTPPGMAIGAIQGAANLIPDLYEGNYGSAAIDAASILPFAKPITNTVKSAVQNTYKINPWAFKPDPKAYYRMIGKEGYTDALESGVVRPPQTSRIFDQSSQQYKDIPIAAYDDAYYNAQFPLDRRWYPNSIKKTNPQKAALATKSGYQGPYMAEVTGDSHLFEKGENVAAYTGPNSFQTVTYSKEHIPITNPNLKFYKEHWLKGYKEVPKSQSAANAPVRSGLGGVDMSRYEIKNPDYYSQLLDTYTSKVLSSSNKKFYKSLIETVKKQNGLVTEKQLNELDRLKTGNFDFGKRGYNYPNQPTEFQKAGFDGNLITRPLTPFSSNELTTGNQWYRKIGNEAGLQDLINQQGAKAPAPMKMKSGIMLDAPFFGRGASPTESYKGLYAVEVKPEAASKYNWRSRVAGVDNYGSVPFENDKLVSNFPLEDLNVYRKKWFSNNYKQLDPTNLEEGLKNAALQRNLENVYKWGVRGYLGKSGYDYVNTPNEEKKYGGEMHNAPVLTTSMLLKRFK